MGNPKYIKQADRTEAFPSRFEEAMLRSEEQLPDIDEEKFALQRDIRDVGDEGFTDIRLGDRVIFSEIAAFERFARFADVCRILKSKRI